MGKHKRIGQLLIEDGAITEQQLTDCLERQRENHQPLGEILIENGLIDEKQLVMAIGRQLGLKYIEIHQTTIDEEAIHKISETVARKYLVIPISLSDHVLTVAISDPLNLSIIDDLHILTSYDIEVVVGDRKDIEWAINRYYFPQQSNKFVNENEQVKRSEEDRLLEEHKEDGPTILFVHSMISKGLAMSVSDIHIEPHEKEVIIRYRIDGILYDTLIVPANLEFSVISRLKIMANLHITEKRKPQDGGFHLNVDGRSVDVRMSTIPTIFGEKVVLRLLEKEQIIEIDQLGFLPDHLAMLRDILKFPHGIVLITGPTGSGKTTTLYAMLNEINNLEKNIVTIEDPVEYVLPRINQTQINFKTGITFASGLRTMLRQDPDIIMVGEIRDEETAKVAVQAALTGHLVLSTLHTNTAIGSFYRLLNMGIEPYLLSSSLKGMISQRLVRKVCSKCKEEVEIDQSVFERLGLLDQFKDSSFVKGKGCFHCQQTGYRGRLGVQEVIKVDDEMRVFINRNAAEEVATQLLKNKQDYRSIIEDGMIKASRGLTSVEEVLRILYQ
ncbi:GspE/PulE family protein [Anaerobacillus sp. MEB173]|uniref:GspE/PulE family protein n=1 Tax=Anaerobacillus sp. MEB173 TaxID=3383345 RepID=UPI003F92F0E3